MPIKKYKPTTAGRRNSSVNAFTELTGDAPEKTLLAPMKSKAGRNNTGRITIRHRGGGHKRRYRVIDFKQTEKIGVSAVIKTVEYDPNRSAFIMLVQYADGEKRYHLAHQGVTAGEEIIVAEKAPIKDGSRMQLRNIPTSYKIFNIEMEPGQGGQIIRSAGSSATLMSLDSEKAQVLLPSGETRLIDKSAYATIGSVSNQDHSQVRIGKAGRTRWLGRRPQVRGKAMNPCDHPHGGGEGRSPIGMKAPKTPWGAVALGRKTRSKKKWTNRLILTDRHGMRKA